MESQYDVPNSLTSPFVSMQTPCTALENYHRNLMRQKEASMNYNIKSEADLKKFKTDRTVSRYTILIANFIITSDVNIDDSLYVAESGKLSTKITDDYFGKVVGKITDYTEVEVTRPFNATLS